MDTGNHRAASGKQFAYIGIDESSGDVLRRVKPVLMEVLPGLLGQFYERTMAVPELAARFPNAETRQRAKDAQARHWSMLFDGRFDERYLDSARRIGLAHHRIDLTPQWYMSGYAFILGELLAAVAAAQPGLLNTAVRRRELGDTLRAVSRAVLLDMDLAMSAYWDSLTHETVAAVDGMIERIDTQVIETVESVTVLTDDLVSSAQTMSGVTATVGESTASASGAAGEALSSAETVAAAAEELHASIAEIADRVSQTARIAHDAVGQMSGARAVLDRLDSAAAEIGRVVEIIGSIAAQTNLLALNATIEAARAGEAGKGFAVVAGEVKNLANQSARSAEDITGRVGAIQEVTRETLKMIDAVSQAISRMEAGAADISAAVEEQTAATSEIARNIGITAERAKDVHRIMERVEDSVRRADQVAHTVNESADRMDESMSGMRKLLVKAVRTSSKLADRRKENRRAAMVEAQLHRDGKVEQVLLYDLSEYGAMAASSAPCTQGARMTLAIPAAGVRLEVQAVACKEGFHHLNFIGDGLPTATVEQLCSTSVEKLIEMTKNDHRAFVAKVADAVAGKISLLPADLSTHHTCRLGRWYDSVTDETMVALASFRELFPIHRQVHAKGRDTLALLAEGRHDEAQQRMGELQELSRQVVAGLDRLGAELKRSRAA
nr:protoglobin domain-containing protein [Azospirillum thermophilum]